MYDLKSIEGYVTLFQVEKEEVPGSPEETSEVLHQTLLRKPLKEEELQLKIYELAMKWIALTPVLVLAFWSSLERNQKDFIRVF